MKNDAPGKMLMLMFFPPFSFSFFFLPWQNKQVNMSWLKELGSDSPNQFRSFHSNLWHVFWTCCARLSSFFPSSLSLFLVAWVVVAFMFLGGSVLVSCFTSLCTFMKACPSCLSMCFSFTLCAHSHDITSSRCLCFHTHRTFHLHSDLFVTCSRHWHHTHDRSRLNTHTRHAQLWCAAEHCQGYSTVITYAPPQSDSQKSILSR